MDSQKIKFEENNEPMDEETFSRLYTENYNFLRNYAFKNIRNTNDADDIVQTAFANVCASKTHSINEDNFIPYMKTSVYNECKKYFDKRDKHNSIYDVYAIPEEVPTYMPDSSGYEHLIEPLKDRDREIFNRRFKDKYTEKEISEEFDLKEGSVKSIFSRGGKQIKDYLKKFPLVIFIICVCISVAVAAVSFISYIQNMFRTYKNGMTNDGVLEAIETKGWFQKCDMDYVDLGDGYKVKLDYFLLDEMSLYLVFDLESEKDLSKYNEFSILDLKVENENGEIIYAKTDLDSEQHQKVDGTKNVSSSPNHIKQLLYIYTDSFPASSNLNISFSRFTLHKRILFYTNRETINSSFNISVNISEKFKNRNYTNYISNNNKLRKALIAETGFYGIINLNYLEEITAILIDENGNEYDCFTSRLNNYDDNPFSDHIIVSKFNNKNCNYLKLIIDNVEYELKNQP